MEMNYIVSGIVGIIAAIHAWKNGNETITLILAGMAVFAGIGHC